MCVVCRQALLRPAWESCWLLAFEALGRGRYLCALAAWVSYNSPILRPPLQAAAKVEVDAGPFQAAMDTLIRDKNQALDQLDKVGEGTGRDGQQGGAGPRANCS